MRTATATLAFIGCALMGGNARADPITVATTSIATSGTFDCRWTLVCSGEGTNSITFGSGDDTATLTFTGVNSTFDVTNSLTTVTLGEFELTATPGFRFPTNPANPALPIVSFGFTIDQSAPVAADSVRSWGLGPGARAVLPLQQGFGVLTLPIGPNPFMYSAFVYTLNPFPFTIHPGRTALKADVGAVPEPATMLLLGSGLAGLAAARRRRANRGLTGT